MDEKRKDQEQAEAPTQEQSTSKASEETLDLTIETVEDRINPSETNVFDK